MSELDVLFPHKEITLTTGETISIKPFSFGQLPKAIKLGQKIGGLIAQMAQSKEFEKGTAGTNVAMIIGEGGEDLISLIGLGINKPRDWFDTLQADDGVTLVIAFLEVNVDFFTQRMLPSMAAAMEKFKKAK